MNLRLPQNLSTQLEPKSGLAALELEIAGERAATLGRLGREVEQSLRRLRAVGGNEAGRAAMVGDAADAVWAFFVTRELCGLTNHDLPIEDYAIPHEVLAQLGARR